ncbi:hypothetical protein PI87_02645 [Ralstonia sp. A12]|nr:hypothetical protein PI87_02645 [Ralstonia sp. A12]
MIVEYPEVDLRRAPVLPDAEVRPLRWWPAAQLGRLAGDLQEVLAQWARDWGLPTAAPGATCAPQAMAASEHFLGDGAADAIERSWIALRPGSTTERCWWTVGAPGDSSCVNSTEGRHDRTPLGQAGSSLLAALFAASHEAPMMLVDASAPWVATCVAADAVEDWCAQLRKWIGAPDGAGSASIAKTESVLREEILQPWSGAVWLALDWCGLRFQLVMDFSCATRLLGQHCAVSTGAEATQPVAVAALVPVLSALSAEVLSMTVELSPVELELGTVSGLRLGDVVRIPHALETPLRVRIADAEPLFQAFLGRIDDHKAVELQPLDTAH